VLGGKTLAVGFAGPGAVRGVVSRESRLKELQGVGQFEFVLGLQDDPGEPGFSLAVP
jgi:hypothetical protein